MSSADNSLRQFERIEKEVAAESGQNRQNRDPLANMQQNSEQRSTDRQEPYIQEIEEDDDEQSLNLPPHEEFARQGMAAGEQQGSDLPMELSYQRLLLNSPSTGSTAQSNSRPASGEASAGRARSASASGGTANGGRSSKERRQTTSTGTMTTSGETEEEAEERERRKQEMIDRANAMLPRPGPDDQDQDNNNHQNGAPELVTPAHRRFASSSPSPLSSIFSTTGSGGSKTPQFSPLFFPQPPLSNSQRRTKTPSTLMEPLKVPDFKQAELRPPPTLEQVKAAAGLTRSPMFHSTPHNQQQQTGGGALKSAGKTKKFGPVGARPISPIAEERDLERLVAEMVDNTGQQKGGGMDPRVVKSLVTQLRDLIAQWDWAQARHRHVAKIYFERQHEELNARWEQLNADLTKFNEQKADEWAQIAKVRAGLHAERVKQLGKKEADRIRELEQEIIKLKAKEALSSQRTSEQRTRIRELEGEVRVREQSYTENMIKIKKMERQLVTAEQENANLRTRNTMLRSELQKLQKSGSQSQPSASSSSSQQQQQMPGPRATLLNLGAGRGNQQQNGTIRRNNSDTTFSTQSGPNQQAGERLPSLLHRSNSENGTGGGPMGLPSGNGCQGRQRVVRFAEPSPANNVSDPSAMALFAATTGNNNDTLLDGENATALAKRFDIPTGMINTMYRITGRGREYTFESSSGPGLNQQSQQRIVVTELMACRRGGQGQTQTVPCLLYEWPVEGNFRWLNGQRGQPNRKVQIDYLHSDRLYEVRMPQRHLLRFHLDGQLELVWCGGDRTLVMPDGERREIYSPEQPDFHIEIFPPSATIAYRLSAQTQWQREQFVPDPSRTSVRPHGAYVAQHAEPAPIGGGRNNDQQQGQQQQSVQINSPDFQLRRFADTRAVKLALDKWAGIQLWLCPDNVLLVKHVGTRGAEGGGREGDNDRENGNGPAGQGSSATVASGGKKRVCFAHGQCRHINTATGQ